ncbi:methyltransferase domain-containing protein [Micromonospora tulbaghiae]|uniref:class I SAM-dependent methyltransferase n=1 Tax=Micromonospora tulbaghiae TaxID=479978 RepID=UPI0033A037C7
MGGDDQRLSRRGSFVEDPDSYQAARPGYPRLVYEVLADCGLRPGARVLEIGPGTGQVTRPLVAAGASVLAVELGGRLAARLRTNLAGRDVTVIEGDFATVALPDGTFDLAVCATAFHWLDRLRRCGGWPGWSGRAEDWRCGGPSSVTPTAARPCARTWTRSTDDDYRRRGAARQACQRPCGSPNARRSWRQVTGSVPSGSR